MSSKDKGKVEKDTPKKCPIQRVRGFPFPEAFFLPHLLEQAISLKPLDTDIFVVTYPKCGTTWTQYIVWEIIHKGAVPPSPNQMVFRDFPFLEATGTEILDHMPSPRLLKTHLPFHLNPYNPKAKYIYVVRNPWDCCVSYFYHNRNEPGLSNMKWEDYLECLMLGEIGWGDFFDHVLSWYEHRNDPNILFLTYEEMKKDKRKTILGIAKFLGDQHFENVNNEEVLQNCLKHSDFQYMKKLGMFFPKENPIGESKDTDPEVLVKTIGEIDQNNVDRNVFEEVTFFRKGIVGDWKNHFSQDQLERFNAYMLKKLKNTEMENFWKPVVIETTL